MTNRCCACLLATLVAVAPGWLQARELTAEQQRAKKLFDTAMSLVDQGKHALACPMLEESLELDAGTGTKYHLARCYEALGKLATAHRLLGEVADEARQARRPDRERHARDQAARLEPRLPRLTLSVPDELAASPSLHVTVDGVEVPRSDWGGTRPIDLGEHEVVARQEGSALAWREKLFVAREAERLAVRVPVLESLRHPTRAPSAPGRARDAAAKEPATTPTSGGDRADASAGFDWLLAGGVASAVGSVAAAVLFTYAWVTVDTIDEDADYLAYRQAIPPDVDVCDAAEAGVDAPGGATAADVSASCSRARKMEILQAVTLPASIVFAGLALVLTLSSDTATGGDATSTDVAVLASPTAGAMVVRGRF